MEGDLKKNKMEDDLKKIENGRRPKLFFLKNKNDNPRQIKIEDDKKKLKMTSKKINQPNWL
jgi:hypothetical protein